jgi:CheY-like chemotaxis protein
MSHSAEPLKPTDDILIYVVEDDEEQIMLLRLILTGAGYRVVTQSDADKVLDGIRDLRPDVILLDVMLPSREGLDGFAICQQMRQDPDISTTKVIIVSAIAEGTTAELENIRRQVGADAYILKPYDPAMLLQTIREILQ